MQCPTVVTKGAGTKTECSATTWNIPVPSAVSYGTAIVQVKHELHVGNSPLFLRTDDLRYEARGAGDDSSKLQSHPTSNTNSRITITKTSRLIADLWRLFLHLKGKKDLSRPKYGWNKSRQRREQINGQNPSHCKRTKVNSREQLNLGTEDSRETFTTQEFFVPNSKIHLSKIRAIAWLGIR